MCWSSICVGINPWCRGSYRNRNIIEVSRASEAISCASVLSACRLASWRWTLLTEKNGRREATRVRVKDILSWEVNEKTAHYTRLIALLCCVSPLISLLSTSRSFRCFILSASRVRRVSQLSFERDSWKIVAIFISGDAQILFFVFYHNKQRKTRLIKTWAESFPCEKQKTIEW